MICQRCGTEYSDEGICCPRCGFGRPKEKNPLPQWMLWAMGGGGVVLLTCVTLLIVFLSRQQKDWIQGSWEGAALSLAFNTEEETFSLKDGTNELAGTYTVDQNSFGLTAEDGSLYVYRYQRAGSNKMELQYTRNNEIYKTSLERVSEQAPYLYFEEERLTLPRLYLDTDGKEVESRTQYLNASISIEGTKRKYQLEETPVRIRGRGNSTWLHFDKKPYKLRFGKKTDLFGMGAAKEWVLLSNSFDETMMRNYLAFSIAEELGMEYSTEFQFVNVFMNGDYIGVYLLCEQTEAGESRVNVEEAIPAQVDTGYFIKGIDTIEKDETARDFEVDEVNGLYLGDKGNFRFYIKSPGGSECTDAQYSYISEYVNQVNDAILSKDWETVCALVDVDSMVKMFLVDEVTLNNDMGYCFYLYKKAGGKLYFGPPWDYDQSCGGSSWGGTTYVGWETGSTHYWYNTLVEIPEFRAAVAAEYKEHQDFFHELCDFLDKTVEKNHYDIAMNNDLWSYQLFGFQRKWRRVEELVAFETYEEHTAYLKTWLTNRLEWIEDELEINP